MIVRNEEINGIKEILAQFDDQEVLALSSTVTQGLLKYKLDDRNAAIEAIIKYSTDINSFLRRKAVTRDSLFYYLHSHGIEIQLPTTKDKLIERIVTYLNCNEESSNDISPVLETNGTVEQQNTRTGSNLKLDEMALQFSGWFYNMLNEDAELNEDHFYEDAVLFLNLFNDQQLCIEECIREVKNIVFTLYNTKREHNLYFNPNLTSDGTRAIMDPHGLVQIITCGTLHINQIVTGVFEQMFALARDPFSENNWKIKSSKLILRNKRVNQTPRICDSDFSKQLNTIS